jgi:hypothetical protein
MKVHISLIPQKIFFCSVVRNVIHVYIGLGTAFMILVVVCVAPVRYTSRKVEEPDALLIMHMSCYNEQSCAEQSIRVLI